MYQDQEKRRAYFRRYKIIHKEELRRKNREWRWKSGVEYYKIKRHESGKSKRYNNCFLSNPNPEAVRKKREYYKLWIKANPEKKKLYNQQRRALRGGAGLFSIKIIQQVYEDNIKKYGTLTCIYCLKPIEFGKDSLEHKIPLTRGGTNEYENLAIACIGCNCRKHNKTVGEFRDA